jgi:hypothetical protein
VWHSLRDGQFFLSLLSNTSLLHSSFLCTCFKQWTGRKRVARLVLRAAPWRQSSALVSSDKCVTICTSGLNTLFVCHVVVFSALCYNDRFISVSTECINLKTSSVTVTGYSLENPGSIPGRSWASFFVIKCK